MALAVTGCSDDSSSRGSTTTSEGRTSTTPATTTVPERPTSTTTTAYDPASVEGAVEAAYLRSWDVYADAVYNLELDEAALAEVYAEEGLANVTKEVADRIESGRAALVEVEHNYEVVVTSGSVASVIDRLTNHQVLIDPETKRVTEDDPNEAEVLNFVIKRIGDEWFVTLIQRID